MSPNFETVRTTPCSLPPSSLLPWHSWPTAFVHFSTFAFAQLKLLTPDLPPRYSISCQKNSSISGESGCSLFQSCNYFCCESGSEERRLATFYFVIDSDLPSPALISLSPYSVAVFIGDIAEYSD